MTGIELYPKQDKLRTGPGSLVQLPLGIHRRTGKRYGFITATGEPLAPTVRAQVTLLANPERVPLEFINGILARAPEARRIVPTPRFDEITIPRPGISPAEGKLSERIKASISVADFVGQYVQLDAQGRGYCPFHDDQHKSFGVNVEGNFWHCFAGCGGGSIIDFWMRWREKYGQDGSFTPTVIDLAELLLKK